MALSSAEIAALTDYTAAETLKLVKYAIVQLLAGAQEYSVAGKTWKRADLDKLRKFQKELENEAAMGDQGMIGGFVRFGNPQ